MQPRKIPVRLRLRLLYDCLNINLGIISLTPMCKLRRQNHAGKEIRSLINKLIIRQSYDSLQVGPALNQLVGHRLYLFKNINKGQEGRAE